MSQKPLPTTAQHLSHLRKGLCCSPNHHFFYSPIFAMNPSDFEASQTLAPSHQSPASTLMTTSSISLFCSDVSGNGDSSQNNLCYIFSVVQEIVNQCHIYWVSMEVLCVHVKLYCTTRICSGDNCQNIQIQPAVPSKNLLLLFIALYSLLFDHNTGTGWDEGSGR